MESNYKDGPVSHKNHILTNIWDHTIHTDNIGYRHKYALLTQIGGGKILNSTKYI